MAITSGFFDSVNGDRTYNAEQMSSYFDGLISDGVYENIGDRFLVTSANDGMSINVGSGRAIIQSHWVKNDSSEVLTLDPSDVQLNRIDAIALRLDVSERSIELVIKKGTAVNGNPSLPAVTRTESVYELYLASVYVKKGAAQPTSVTDLRPSSYCGWVTGIIKQVDTSDLFTQWDTAYKQMFFEFDQYMAAKKAEFNAWFTTLTSELKVEAGFVKLENVVAMPPGHEYVGVIIPIGIDEYDPETDALMVFLNGAFLIDGYDYVQKKHGGENAIQYIGKPFAPSSMAYMTFVVFKNIIGKNVLYASDAAPSASGINLYTAGISEFSEV